MFTTFFVELQQLKVAVKSAKAMAKVAFFIVCVFIISKLAMIIELLDTVYRYNLPVAYIYADDTERTVILSNECRCTKRR